jgi:NAD(P)-dependent dehydrogenase (short-subunit alcohol dehydrogenase family)
MKTDLEDRVAVVTGAGRGIGRAVALALAQAGAKVAALARTQSEIEQTAALIKKSSEAQAFAVDVTDASGVLRAMEKIEAALGPVDVLVNNAGQLGRIGPFVDSDPGDRGAADGLSTSPRVCCRTRICRPT